MRPDVAFALPALAGGGVERVYLMTTNSAGFYEQLGFRNAAPQALLVKPGAAQPPGFRETSGLSDAPG